MADASTGLNRLFGETTMLYLSELRRQAVVATSEIDEAVPASDDNYPRTVDVLRYRRTAAGDPRVGLAGTWSAVAGLTNLTGRVCTNGEWTDRETGTRIALTQTQRIVRVADIPAAGTGAEDDLLQTDRLSFDDAVYGEREWEITEVRVSKRDGIAVALCELARSEATP